MAVLVEMAMQVVMVVVYLVVNVLEAAAAALEEQVMSWLVALVCSQVLPAPLLNMVQVALVSKVVARGGLLAAVQLMALRQSGML